MRTLKKVVRAILVIGVVAGGLFAWLHAPYSGFKGEVFVTLARGKGTRAMGEALAGAGVIRYPWEFWLARLMAPGAKLQAGEYRFEQPANVLEVFERIRRGDTYHFDFTVPEGSNIFDIARLVESEGLMSGDDFLQAAADPTLIRDLAPKAKSLEGYLFPSTYRLSHSTTALELCSMMTGEFRKQIKKLALTSELTQTVTLASLVEKETAVAEERPLVAGVFANRLRIGMRLGCDPTVIYAAMLENRYRGDIHRSDLDNSSPYNTYQHEGLPPGPIANPGAASLEAAANPAKTEYLYFVAKPEGGSHVFSTTLGDHDKAVKNYRHGTQTKAAPKSTRKAG